MGLGVFCVLTYPQKGCVMAKHRTGVGELGMVFWANETPSGQNETHLGYLYEKWAKVL